MFPITSPMALRNFFRLGFRPDDVHADLAALPQLFGGHGPHADCHTDLTALEAWDGAGPF